jgi:hypothetical protein
MPSLLRRGFDHAVETDIRVVIAAIGNSPFARKPDCRPGASIVLGYVFRDAVLEPLRDAYRIMFFQLIRKRMCGHQSRDSDQNTS